MFKTNAYIRETNGSLKFIYLYIPFNMFRQRQYTMNMFVICHALCSENYVIVYFLIVTRKSVYYPLVICLFLIFFISQ